ncbi:hypothetical protein [Dinoroseobacter sp. S76]|uniref:hypothetical protein n=1 Tax=Dinoroseobacter sp. S76 TaxID=3415124 RepID=UPI003C7C73ED
MPKEAAKTVLSQSKRLMAAMEPGDSLIFLNGPAGDQIASLDLPEGDEGQEILSSKRKLGKFVKGPLTQVQGFIVEAAKRAEGLGPDQVPMQVNLPGVLHGLSIHAQDTPSVFVFGTMRYQGPGWPNYSMAHSFPNDAHVNHRPDQTPFGAQGREDYLTGTKVNFCDLDQGYVKDIQRLGLERATGLMIEGYGATVANLTQDIKQCVTSGLEGAVDKTKSFVADPSAKDLIVYDANQTAKAPSTSSQEQTDLLNRIGLAEDDKAIMKDLMGQNRVVLAEVYLYDTGATDGDVVALLSGPLSFEVRLKRQKQQVIVPITDGVLKLKGVRDGGGGITVGVKTKENDTVVSPVMRVGQVINLPFLKLSS